MQNIIRAVLMLLTVCVYIANGQPYADTLQERLYSVCDYADNAIVKVYAQKKIRVKDSNGNEKLLETLDVGSGFIIGKDGIVMTSAYVTHDAEKVWVAFNKAPFEASIVGFDPLTTLSILKIKGGLKRKSSTIINIDASSSLPKLGTMLVLLSSELGLPVSPRVGVASGHNIEFGGNFLPTVYLRTTIPAPRGATGGAVFDINGKFVGMVIASIPEMSGSFVLPARVVAKLRDDILNNGSPVYSWFGIRTEDSEFAEGVKIIVNFVAENSPAKRGGIKIGDEILEINSRKVSDNTQLRDITFFVRPTERVSFKIKRNQKIMNIEVIADIMPSDIIGLAKSDLSKKIAKKKSNNLKK